MTKLNDGKHKNEERINERMFTNYLIKRNKIVEVMIDGVSGHSPMWRGEASERLVGWYNNPKKLSMITSLLESHDINYTNAFVSFNMPKRWTNKGIKLNQLFVPGRTRGKFIKDKDISYRSNLFIDVDPVIKARPVKEAITEECISVCKKINKELRKLGSPKPMVMRTGNGAAIFLPLKGVKNCNETNLLLKQLYRHITKYSNNDAKVDISVGNPSRYCRLPGTYNYKDIGNSENWFRRCEVIYFPSKVEHLDFGGLKKIVQQLQLTPCETQEPETRKKCKISTTGRYSLDIKKYLGHYNMAIVKIKRQKTATLYCLKNCVFDNSHGPNDAAIVQEENGKLSYQCFHTSCRGKTWNDAKIKISGSDSLKRFFRGRHYDIDFLNPQYSDIKILCLSDILEFEFEDNPLIKNLIDEDETLIIYGPPSVGKSALTKHLSLWGAHPFKEEMFGLFKFNRPFTTLFIQAENPVKQIQKRCKLQTKYWPNLKHGVNHVHYLSTGNTGRISGQFSHPSFQKILINSIMETNAELLIIDPLIEYCKGVGENINEAMIVELSCLKSICEFTGTALIIIHHTGKDNRNYRGASSIGGWADRIIKLDPTNKDGEECFKMIFEKTRNQEDLHPITIRKTGLKFERVSGSTEDEIDIVVMALRDLGGNVDKQKDLVSKIVEDNKMGASTARRKVEATARAGKIQDFKNGQSKGYCLVGVSQE